MADRNGTEARPEASPDLFKWHGAEFIFVPLMMATGILGNMLVLYITHFRWKDSIFSFFIKVLAWLDLSNLVLAFPMFLVITVQPDHPGYEELCGCVSFVALFTAVTSALVLVVIAANRFRKLYQPQRSQVTLPLARKLTIACFILGAFCGVPSFWVFAKNTVPYNAFDSPVNVSYCFIKHDADLSLLLTWAVFMGLIFMVVLNSLVLLYGFTIRALQQHAKRISTMMRRPSAVSNSSKRIATKHTWVFIGVTAMFFIAYSPYFITVVLLLAQPSIESSMGPASKAFFDLAKLFPLLSNMSNPIIYSFTSDRFRGECKKVFKLRPCMKMLNIQRKDSISVSHDLSHSEDS